MSRSGLWNRSRISLLCRVLLQLHRTVIVDSQRGFGAFLSQMFQIDDMLEKGRLNAIVLDAVHESTKPKVSLAWGAGLGGARGFSGLLGEAASSAEPSTVSCATIGRFTSLLNAPGSALLLSSVDLRCTLPSRFAGAVGSQEAGRAGMMALRKFPGKSSTILSFRHRHSSWGTRHVTSRQAEKSKAHGLRCSGGVEGDGSAGVHATTANSPLRQVASRAATCLRWGSGSLLDSDP
jgi:hypothetical protein